MKLSSVIITVLAVLFLITGCASFVVDVDYDTDPWQPPFELYEGESLVLLKFVDARGGASSSNAGKIDGRKVVLTEDISTLATRAFAVELTSAGMDISNDPSHDYVRFMAIGEVKEFAISSKGGGGKGATTLAVTLAARLVDNKSGQALWSGKARASGETTISGSSEQVGSELSALITDTLSRAARGVIDQAAPDINRLWLESLQFEAPPAEEKPVKKGLGRVTVSTEPPLAAVYIDGVYQGMSPVSVDVKPGAHTIKAARPGSDVVKEDISVGAGAYLAVDIIIDADE